MKRLTRSLSVRVSALYVVLLFVLCLICGAIALDSVGAFLREQQQQRDRDLAALFAPHLGRALQGDPTSVGVDSVVARMRALHPGLEPYLLDARGRIVEAFGQADSVRIERVDVAPVRRLLGDEAPLPILGPDPKHPERLAIFSAAPIELTTGGEGYLYVLLHDPSRASSIGGLRRSYVLEFMATTMLITVVFGLLIGTLLFWFVLRHFRHLTRAVRKIRMGERRRLREAEREDEVGELAAAINEMTATIEAQVQALERTDALRRDLIANVSHDLRTPLTSARAYVERMAAHDASLTSEERREVLDAVLGDLIQLGTLTAQLSDLSKLDARHAAAQAEPFSLAELMQDVVVKFRPEAEARGVALEAIYSPTPPVRADIGLIDRALSNLVDNALKNTAPGGHVRVGVEQEGDTVCVRVSDNGRGIPEDELSLITQRFYRGQHGPDYEGSGLGLAIARETLELHGQRLEVRSVVGEGSTFSFRLPIASAGDAPARVGPQRGGHAAGGNNPLEPEPVLRPR
jgi:two-component system OmpR family sensor kinase